MITGAYWGDLYVDWVNEFGFHPVITHFEKLSNALRVIDEFMTVDRKFVVHPISLFIPDMVSN
jgi:hypothetical protein